MSTPAVPCRQCGVQILTATAERTGGTCMPCFKGPVPQDTSVLARWLAANLSSAQILALLDGMLVEICKQVAAVAVNTLAEEGIYGFWLSHHIFTNVYATVSRRRDWTPPRGATTRKGVSTRPVRGCAGAGPIRRITCIWSP